MIGLAGSRIGALTGLLGTGGRALGFGRLRGRRRGSLGRRSGLLRRSLGLGYCRGGLGRDDGKHLLDRLDGMLLRHIIKNQV